MSSTIDYTNLRIKYNPDITQYSSSNPIEIVYTLYAAAPDCDPDITGTIETNPYSNYGTAETYYINLTDTSTCFYTNYSLVSTITGCQY